MYSDRLPGLGWLLSHSGPPRLDWAQNPDILAELGNRDQIFLATKVGAGNRGVAAGVKEMEESLKRLRTDKLDLLMVHNLNGIREMLPVLREWKESLTSEPIAA